MAEETVIGFRVDVQTEAGQETVGNLRQEFIEAKKAVLEAKAGTEEYNKALLVLAEKKAKIQDLNQTIRALNPEQLINNFSRLGNAIIGGFTAATSAAALFGAESEDVQKALLKVQAALGLLQGFQAIQEGVKAFGFLRIAITQVTTALGAMKTAFLAAGIGALVIALGFLIEALSDAAEKTKQLAEEQKRLREQAEADAKFYGDLAVTGAQKELELARIRKASLEEIHELELRLNDKKLASYKEILAEKGFLDDADFLRYQELQNDRELIDAQYVQAVKERNAELEEERKRNTLIDGSTLIELKKTQNDELIALEQELRSQETEIQTRAFEQQLTTERFIQNERLRNKLALDQALMQSEQILFGAVANLGNIFIKNEEKQIAFQKKAAAVQIIVEQAVALAKAVKSAAGVPFPGNLVSIATSVASIIAIFASIKSLLSKAGGVEGVTLDTGGVGGSLAAPGITPPVIQSESTIIGGQNTTNEDRPGTQPPIRAYVIESEISASQRRVDKLEAEASFG